MGWSKDRSIGPRLRGVSGRLLFNKPQGGSALLLALVVCLCVASTVHVLTMVVLCGRCTLADEEIGLARLGQAGAGLGLVREGLAAEWEGWQECEAVEVDPVQLPGTAVSVSGLEGSEDWAVEAQALTGDDDPGVKVSAWVEKGRDGLDLPRAALVARGVTCDALRTTAWFEATQDEIGAGSTAYAEGYAYAYLIDEPSPLLIGEGCSIAVIFDEWGLGRGWRDTLSMYRDSREEVTVVQCAAEETVSILPEDVAHVSDGGMLIVLLGSGVLDARGLGELRAVLVADGGTVLLDGTILRGGLFVTGYVDMGTDGRLIYDENVCGWARDRSLLRTRLVPGSRREGME